MCFYKRFLFLILISLASIVQAYEKPAYLDDQTWSNIQKHLLPEDHPLREKLDKLFAKRRWIESLDTLEKGGFKYNKHMAKCSVVVAKHRKLLGYVLKFFTDDQVGINELERLLKRIWGANLARNIIEKHHYGDLFKVPQKWLYPLQDVPSAENLDRKHFILVTEDMNLASSRTNYGHWGSSKISKELIGGLFTILNEGGFNDSVYLHNVPFSLDGRVAFCDTEHFLRWPIEFERLTNCFSKSNQRYWESLILKSKEQ